MRLILRLRHQRSLSQRPCLLTPRRRRLKRLRCLPARRHQRQCLVPRSHLLRQRAYRRAVPQNQSSILSGRVLVLAFLLFSFLSLTFCVFVLRCRIAVVFAMQFRVLMPRICVLRIRFLLDRHSRLDRGIHLQTEGATQLISYTFCGLWRRTPPLLVTNVLTTTWTNNEIPIRVIVLLGRPKQSCRYRYRANQDFRSVLLCFYCSSLISKVERQDATKVV
mmetsp:Transcript_15837/g.18276  ORF Transcript_15837/g.18276 Transcript_15837/m.18276 type:complete len:220 (-) Transcript_15837:918-1577(-)